MNEDNLFLNEKLLNTFKAEANDRIKNIANGLVSLKDDPGNEEIFTSIAREAHTLKGSSRMLGFDDISTVSHKMEDLFGELKEGKSGFTDELGDILYEALESIRILLESRLAKKESGIDVRDLCERIEEARGLKEPAEKSQEAPSGEVEKPEDAVVEEAKNRQARLKKKKQKKLVMKKLMGKR
ncbi:Hpt domain-containing protein [Elusimicrobiota bacterium]